MGGQTRNRQPFKKMTSEAHLLVVRLPGAERNAGDAIQRLQQETERIVVNEDNSAEVVRQTRKILHMVSVFAEEQFKKFSE